jgi:hypothetical protein
MKIPASIVGSSMVRGHEHVARIFSGVGGSPARAMIGLLPQPMHGCETLREGLAGIGLRPRSGGAITLFQEAPR